MVALQVASLVALLLPTVFKYLNPRFERARVMFEDSKSLMRSAIQEHIVSIVLFVYFFIQNVNTCAALFQRANSGEIACFFQAKREINNGAPAEDFIDIYLDEIEQTKDDGSSFYANKGLMSLECVLVDLFIGGSETTSTTINWTVLYLLHNPKVQDKIHAELDQIVGKNRQVFRYFIKKDWPMRPVLIWEN